jgi:hypothetical protein
LRFEQVKTLKKHSLRVNDTLYHHLQYLKHNQVFGSCNVFIYISDPKMPWFHISQGFVPICLTDSLHPILMSSDSDW